MASQSGKIVLVGVMTFTQTFGEHVQSEGHGKLQANSADVCCGVLKAIMLVTGYFNSFGS